jgi:nucleoside-diphosphate-sugar epimerase
MAKVMVNGATGLVGRAIVDEFLRQGHTVRVSDRPGSEFSALAKMGLEVVPAEITDPAAVGKTVEGVEIVVHVAGVFDFRASKAELEAANHQGVRVIAEAAKNLAPNLQRFVHIATVGVYGQPVRSPCREDDPKRPRNAYEQSKYRGELAAFEYHRRFGLPVTSLRPTLIYGPRARYGHAMFIGIYALLKALGVKAVPSLKSGPRSSHVHVEDVARGAALIATHPQAVGQAFNMTDPTPLDGPTFLRALTQPLGLKLREVIPFWPPLMKALGALTALTPLWVFDLLNRRLARHWDEIKAKHGLSDQLRPRLDRDWVGYMTADNVYDHTRLARLGMVWKYPDPVVGLRETIAWYKEKEWIP